MRISKSWTPVLAMIISICALVGASSAPAAAPTGDFEPFDACPYTDASAIACLKSTSTAGGFTLGDLTVPLTSAAPIVFQGAFRSEDEKTTLWMDAVGAPTLPPTKLSIPGGLSDLLLGGNDSGPVGELAAGSGPSPNDVYATVELAGPIQFEYLALATALDTPGVVLPIKIHIQNPILGPDCYIGSSANPVVLNLTAGTTHPPAGTTSLIGTPGVFSTNAPYSTVTYAKGTKLVDNTFSLPPASNCGALPLEDLVLTNTTNSRIGLPAAPGASSVIFEGTTLLGSAPDTLASVK